MVIWGGLRPIFGQVVIDTLSLFGFSVTVYTKDPKFSSGTLVTTCSFTMLASGNLTNRWTIIFPMIPIVILHILRQATSNNIIHRIIIVFSSFFIVMAGLLSVLFPAVELPPLRNAPYNVGMVDVFLPISFELPTSMDNAVEDICPRGQDHVSVRFLYPTLEESGYIPYLRQETSDVFCEETMIAGAPDPLKRFGWMLHTWKLTQIKAKLHAEPLQLDLGLPIIVFSHGLGGNADMYAYQTMALAAHGYLVVVIDHSDGSAPVVPRKDGIPLRRNDSHVELLEMEGKLELFRRHRRVMTEYRSEEFLAAVRATIALSHNNIDELERYNVSFVGKLKVNEIHYMGHSFGGATSLHAARKLPPASIIAHEPAAEWIPDGTRASLFDQQRLAGSQGNFTFWQVHENDDLSISLHDIEMLILYSSEWQEKNWGGVDALSDMYARRQFGPPNGSSRVAVIEGAHHNEFSDTCLLTPVWLARATGITGKRSPIETAEEIHSHTISFLKSNQ